MRQLPRWLAALIAIACGVVALVGVTLGRFDPRADFLNHFAPLVCLIGAIAGLAALLGASRRRRGVALVGLVGIILGGASTIMPELVARARLPRASGPATLRLLHFNLYKGNSDPAATAAWILNVNPDIITIAEGGVRAQGVLDRIRGAYPYQLRCLARRYCSTMIAAKAAPLALRRFERSDPDNAIGLAALAATFAGPGGPYTLVSLHLTRPWPFGDQARALAALRDYVATHPTRHLIIAGDFNLTPWSYALRRADALVGLPRLTRALPTWPGPNAGAVRLPWPLLPLDQVYAGEGWRLVAIERGPALGSDHYPVLLSLRRRE